MAIADIIVADRLTDANQRLLAGVIGLQVSWSISQPGIMTFDYPTRDMVAAGVNPALLLGKWLHYTHPTAGPWGGQVTNVLPTDGIVSVSAESWLSCLRGVVTTGTITSSSFAATVRTLIRAAKGLTGVDVIIGNATTPSTVDDIAVSLPFGVAPLLQEPGNDLYEQVLPGYLDALGGLSPGALVQVLLPYGYNVDPMTRIFSLKKQIGTDRSATVKLADKITNTGASWGDDLTDVINTVTVDGNILTPGTPSRKKCVKKKKGKCKKYETIAGTPDRLTASSATGKNTASITKYGPRSLRVTLDQAEGGFTSQANLQTQAQTLADAYARNEQSVTVRCADDLITVGSVPKRIFASFFEGDVISVDLANEGVVGKMVIRHRALDVSRGEMTVSGEAEVG